MKSYRVTVEVSVTAEDAGRARDEIEHMLLEAHEELHWNIRAFEVKDAEEAK